MKYTIKNSDGDVVAGLENVPADNAILLRLVPCKPLSQLALGEFTIGTRDGETYEIVRVE